MRTHTLFLSSFLFSFFLPYIIFFKCLSRLIVNFLLLLLFRCIRPPLEKYYYISISFLYALNSLGWADKENSGLRENSYKTWEFDQGSITRLVTLLFIPCAVIYYMCGEEQTKKMEEIGVSSRYGKFCVCTYLLSLTLLAHISNSPHSCKRCLGILPEK